MIWTDNAWGKGFLSHQSLSLPAFAAQPRTGISHLHRHAMTRRAQAGVATQPNTAQWSLLPPLVTVRGLSHSTNLVGKFVPLVGGGRALMRSGGTDPPRPCLSSRVSPESQVALARIGVLLAGLRRLFTRALLALSVAILMATAVPAWGVSRLDLHSQDMHIVARAEPSRPFTAAGKQTAHRYDNVREWHQVRERAGHSILIFLCSFAR